MSHLKALKHDVIREFMNQMGSLDMKLVQRRTGLGKNIVSQLGFVEAKCKSGKLDISDHARGQAAAETICEIISDLQDGTEHETCLAFLVVEHCVKGRKLEIVGQEIGYSRSHSYRLRGEALDQIQARLVELERNHVQKSECSLRRLRLLDRTPNPDLPEDRCPFFEEIIVWIQSKCMNCEDCSLALALA